MNHRQIIALVATLLRIELHVEVCIISVSIGPRQISFRIGHQEVFTLHLGVIPLLHNGETESILMNEKE